MATFTTLTSNVVSLPIDDIDTDQIIPARFLKVTDKAGLGQALFADWRGPDFPLDRPDAPGAQVLRVGRNFEGRQGKGGRTFLASPLTAAAAAVTGAITDPRTLL